MTFVRIAVLMLSLIGELTSLSDDGSIPSPDCSPCKCDFQKPNIILTCKNSSLSTEDFKKVWDFDTYATFRQMGSFSFHMLPAKKRLLTIELTVENSDVQSLDLTGYDNIRKLVLTNVRPLGDRSLTYVPANLKILNATNSSLRNVEIAQNNQLSILDLTDNVFEKLIAQPSLKYISLQSNKIRDFTTSGCTVMSNLSYLDLSRNLIEEVPEDAFNCLLPKNNSTLDVYVTMILSWNKIESIHENAFNGIKLLKVDLSHNMLRSIDSGQFNWRKLQYTNLQFNPWRCDCKAQWILDDLLPLLYGTQQGLLYDFRCSTPRKFENKPMVYWLNRSVDVFCGSQTSLYFTAPGGGEFEVQKITFIVTIVFCILNVILTIALIIVCYKYGFNCGPKKYQKLRTQPKNKTMDKRSLINGKI